LESLDFDSLDGGDGFDVLRLREVGEILLSRYQESISGIEEIELTVDGQRVTVSESLIKALMGDLPLRLRSLSSEQLAFSGQWESGGSMLDGNDVVQVLRSNGSTLYVINENPWQNVLNRFDVDGSGGVSALDALVGINNLERFSADSLLSSDQLPTSFFDVNGDSRLTAIDVLQIINQMTRESAESELLAAPSESDHDDVTDAALDQYGEAEVEDINAGDSLVASFDQVSQSSPSPWGDYQDADESDSEGDELESTLDLLLTDLGR
jgi:hypothetical protein